MIKKPAHKAMQVSEAIVWGGFILAGFLGASAILRPSLFTSFVTHVVAYVLLAYASLALGYMLLKAVENK